MTVQVIQGDSREVVPTLEPDSIDSVVSDPPYALESITKRYDKGQKSPVNAKQYDRLRSGFMGQKWDTGETAFDPEFWCEILRVMKPGAYLVAFGGTRTYHRLACAIEDAGFEIRDQLMFMFGTGFPKNHRIPEFSRIEGKQTFEGFGTALKPAHEPIILARKPVSEKSIAANVLKHGTGALNIGACRVETDDKLSFGSRQIGDGVKYSPISADRMRPGEQDTAGRWPPNLLHDGSPEVLEAFARFGSSESKASMRGLSGRHDPGQGAEHNRIKPYSDGERGHTDTGTAARFFPSFPYSDDDLRFHYSGKAGPDDRLESKHPTVKPIALMRWLVRLCTPPGGTVLDPFAGSGTMGAACIRESFNAILIEREDGYVKDINARLDHISGTDTPLFR